MLLVITKDDADLLAAIQDVATRVDEKAKRGKHTGNHFCISLICLHIVSNMSSDNRQ